MEVLEAELASPEALGQMLGVDVPPSWPPELYDADAVRWAIRWLSDHHDEAVWCLYYVAAMPTGTASGRPALVGVAGYKGAPDAIGVLRGTGFTLDGPGNDPRERRLPNDLPGAGKHSARGSGPGDT